MHNLERYYGTTPQPSFAPSIRPKEKDIEATYLTIGNDSFGVVLENAVSRDICRHLIMQFDQQESYPVGVDGYVNPNENPGSHRAMGWDVNVANHLTGIMLSYVPMYFTNRNDTLIGIDSTKIRKDFKVPFPMKNSYSFLGSTPWLRFMKYAKGGKHTPHYDAPYHNEIEKYITMFSWVLYLNTPLGEGGSFQFVDDGQLFTHPAARNTKDWTKMSDKIVLSVKPEAGKLLIFPHWLCHQVEEYIGEGHRYIIRGDVAYGY
jgi:hypothetical protein